MTVLGAVLAGGASTRMGRDKAEVVVDGRTMLERVTGALAAACDRVVVLGPEREGYETWPDRDPGSGPLGGLTNALERADTGHVLLVAVDNAYVRPETLSRLAALAGDAPVVPVDERGIRQVTCAVYPTAVAGIAREELEAGGSLQTLLDRVAFRPVTPEEWGAWGEDGRSWHSVDDEASLQAAEAAYDGDVPGEACGVFAAYSTTQRVSHLIYFGLFALQHRGQESAGIATSNGETVTVYKDLGLVAQVFDESSLAGLDGHLGIGHTRYSTTGSNTWANSQPAHRQAGTTSIALGHNGNLTNTAELAARLGINGATTDSDLMAEDLARAIDDNWSDDRGLERALMEVAPGWKGAFSLVIMDQGRIVGLRDPHGFRPLCLGSLPDGGWVLASETAALDLVGARFVREVGAGEMVVIDATGVRSYHPFAEVEPKLCLFEFVYFARPDSHMYGRNIHAARTAMGRRLAGEHPVDADVVVPVPESGIPAAQGFAAESGIPYHDGLVKNRYVGRTFIEPTQMLRDRGIRLKLNVLSDSMEGKRVVLVDDSIVRGSTTRKLVEMVREAGATEVHLRVSSPPYRWPCFYGMDTSDRSTLIAATMEVDEIRESLGCDTLGYLSLEGLLEATGVADAGFCTACLSGDYPTQIPEIADKFQLERS
ncbi:MAG TPA: amidophosphoribosyltransferase [Acidimicrobiia bacterium]